MSVFCMAPKNVCANLLRELFGLQNRWSILLSFIYLLGSNFFTKTTENNCHITMATEVIYWVTSYFESCEGAVLFTGLSSKSAERLLTGFQPFA